MATQSPKKPTPATGKKTPPAAPHTVFLFNKENYWIMLAGLGIIILGYLLMIGGDTTDPNQFNVHEVYSWRRITLAPIVIIVGLVVEIYAIMKKPK